MSVPRRLALATIVCCLFRNDPARADTPLNPCEAAGTVAEQAAGLPAGLLLAIGRIESGRWDESRHRTVPWPWTMNAQGRGQLFGSKDDAVRTVGELRAGGMRSIDAGCFQINLMHHPDAFANLDEAFDPTANARYAARFLTGLFARHGSWESAVAAYHSADPALGLPYQRQVYASWTSAGATRQILAAAPIPVPERVVPVPSLPAVYNGVQVWTPLPRGSAPKIVAMPPPDAPQGVPALPAVTQGVPPAALAAAR